MATSRRPVWSWQGRSRWYLIGAVVGSIVTVALTFGIPSVANRVSQLRAEPEPTELEKALASEASIVTTVRPGGQLTDLPGRLGVPASEVANDGKFLRSIFILKFSAVLAVSDAAGRVLFTSAASLTPAFRPTFILPDGAAVKLWTATVAEVHEPSGLPGHPYSAIGHIGASDALYYEWTPPPAGVNSYRQSLYGYSFLSSDLVDDSYSAFMPFVFGKTGWYVPFSVEEITHGTLDEWRKWLDLPVVKAFRAEIPVNTIGYQAENVGQLRAYPAGQEWEVWPHVEPGLLRGILEPSS